MQTDVSIIRNHLHWISHTLRIQNRRLSKQILPLTIVNAIGKN